MIGKTISHYKIVEKTREGGMGVCTRYNDRLHSDGVALALWASFVHFSEFVFSECSVRLNPAPRVKRSVISRHEVA